MVTKRWGSLVVLLVACIFIFYLLGKSQLVHKLESRNTEQQSKELALSTQSQLQPSCSTGATKTSSAQQKCKNGTILLVIILSAPGNKARRDLIRNSWKNSYVEQGKQFMIKFAVGTYKLSEEVMASLNTEKGNHDDLVLLTDHFDSYRNLTRKVLQMLTWADKTTEYSYLLKTDDDAFIKLDTVESELKSRVSTRPLYWGFILTNESPQARGQWKETQWDLCKKYLPYAAGGGYILSRELVHRIALNADALTLYNNEDVSVGAWVSPFKLERKADQRFCATKNSFDRRECAKYVLIHHLSIDEMETSHQLMRTKGVLCEA